METSPTNGEDMSETSTRWWLTQDSTETVIDAPPEHIYALVADMPRMGEWSPECQRLEWLEGSTGPTVGARFVGHNEGGPANLMKWSRKGRVLAADPGRVFAFVTEEGGRESTEWYYRFEPTEVGTRVVESYVVRWIPLWARFVDIPTNRARDLREGMDHTLGQLKKAAEGATAPGAAS
jgi:uncharacterized protein YndB with AHSA1/START domain